MKQLDLGITARRGGKRRGAGRPNRSGCVSHGRRPRLDPRHPLHVTLKLREALPSLRRKDIFKMLRASVRTARLKGLQIAHFAVLSNHVHLILEPKGVSVARPVQSLAISLSKRINAALQRRGAIFRGRYHLHVLRTPSEVRRALAYVFTNDAQHRGRGTHLRIDPFSSALRFYELKELLGKKFSLEFSAWSEELIEDWLGEILRPAETWLLTRGWRRGRL